MGKDETEWLRSLEQELRLRLAPLGWAARLDAPGERRPGRGAADAMLSLSSPDGRFARLRLEFRKPLEPRLVAELQRVAEECRPDALVVGSPYVSPRVRELLTAAGIGYADLTGNLRIALREPALYIETQGAQKSPWREPRPLQSLKGRAVARVLRALCDFRPPYSTGDLAERAQASPATASRVVNLLERERLLTKQGRGRVCEVEWADVIREWTRDYGVLESNESQPFLAARGLAELQSKLAGTSLQYAATASLAARIPTAVAPARLAMLYTNDPETLAEALDLRPVDKGANVILLTPFDPLVFERSSRRGDLICAAFSQVAADLLTSPGRGTAEAEELLRWMKENEDAWRS